MLSYLEIENILLINKVSLEFQKGLVVLTGETGAGKSIILNSILFGLNKKIKVPTASLLKLGSEKGGVTMVFDIPANQDLNRLLTENDIDISSGELILRRTIEESGKSRCFANNKLISANLLEEIGTYLIEIHRQNEQKGLLEPVNHQSILDSYGKIDTADVQNLFMQLKSKKQEYDNQIQTFRKYQDQQDYLVHLVKEIASLNIKDNEEKDLTDKRIEMQKVERSFQVVKDMENKLFNKTDIRSIICSVQRLIGNVSGNEEGSLARHFESISKNTDVILEEMDKIDDTLATIKADFNFSSIDLEEVEERLFQIRDIGRKYNIDPNNIPSFLEENRKILENIRFSDQSIKKLEQEIKNIEDQLKIKCEILTTKRNQVAKDLENAINLQLKEVKMDGAEFCVQITKRDNFISSGQDDVCFIARTNPGMPFGQIHKIASGGELSRFMLALKVALLEINKTPVIIFDEIDTGISGQTSAAVGEKLKRLSAGSQVILVTHQPQIACKALNHFLIKKTIQADQAVTSVTKLNGEQSIHEIARLLSGSHISQESLENAARLKGFNKQ